jgi:drug/metabolite transporter (DMT)-like permease
MQNLTASLMMVLSMAGFAVEDAIIKYLATSLPVGQVMVVIGLGGVLIFGSLAARRGVSLVVRAAVTGAALVRNLAEMIAASFIVLAIALVPLAVVTAIMQMMPLVVTLGAALFLREPVGWRRWSAILVGFLGMLLILRPTGADFDPAALLAVLGVLAMSVRDLATRRLAPGIHSLQVSGWGFTAIVPAGLILMLVMAAPPVAPAPVEWAWLMGALASGVVAYAALVAATRLGDVAVTTPLRYTRLVFAMSIGLVFFGERPDGWTLAGSALIVGAGLYTLMREMRRRTAPSPPAPAPL